MKPSLLPLLFLLVLPAFSFADGTPSKLEEFRNAGMPEEILFCTRKPSVDGHWYANIGFYAHSCQAPFLKHSGGKLCIYNTRTKECRTIFEDPEGNIRDPQIHYDCEKLVFSYLAKGKNTYSLYEINLDGTGLKQLTGVGENETKELGVRSEELGVDADARSKTPSKDSGLSESNITRSVTPNSSLLTPNSNPTLFPQGWDDIEPTYMPDDQIVFCSTRAKRYVQCWATQVNTLHKCNADGSNIRQLSCNVEQDNTPWVLPNGQLIYMRWEYIDRNHLVYHHLWTANADGTRQMVFFGNQHPGGVFLGAKPIPGTTNKVVATFSPGHGMKEHYGRTAIFDPRNGPDDMESITYISKENKHSDPWAFDENHFLVAEHQRIVLLSRDGSEETLYELPEELAKAGYWVNEPRPVMKRPRELQMTDTTDPGSDHGTFAMINFYRGRQTQDLKPGTVKQLMIYEVLPKPINFCGAMSEITSGGSFAVERLIGTVPVSEDGSAYFNVPPLRSLLFCALDEKGHCVKRMHSFTSVMPGEVTVCIGCHEDRLETPSAADRGKINQIMRQPPVDPAPVEGVPEIIDFARDIQPILDRHCLECHNPQREEGGFNISGHWGPLYSIGYQVMSWRELFGDNRVKLPYAEHRKSNFKPYEIGTGSSRLLKLIEEHHAGVQMPENEQKIIRFWLDAGAQNAGTYMVNCWGGFGYCIIGTPFQPDKDWPETKAMEEAMRRRCDRCHCPTEAEKKIGRYDLPAQFYINYYPYEIHQKNIYVAHRLSEDGGRYSRHEVFDLSFPEQSKVLTGPLSKEAGGRGICEAKSGEKVFTSVDDPDYQAILAGIARGRKYILEESNRWCMATGSPNNGPDCPKRFVPRPQYVRELIRYGILPLDWDFNTPVDPWELDQKYWKSLWYKKNE